MKSWKFILVLLVPIAVLGLWLGLQNKPQSLSQAPGILPMPSSAKSPAVVTFDSRLKSQNLVAQSSQDMKKALSELKEFTTQTDSAEIYRVFSELRKLLQGNPQTADLIAAAIRSTDATQLDGQRQLTVLFGALAQSKDSDQSESLADMAQSCPHTFCKRQALMALHDQEHPSPAALEKVLALADSALEDVEISGSALLAAGSMGEHLGPEAGNLHTQLEAKWSSLKGTELGPLVLRAMGNHADQQYIATLNSQVSSPKVELRSAAVYSLRGMPSSSDADGILLKVLTTERNPNVLMETLKALAFRTLNQSQYESIALQSSQWPDADLQMEAARVLMLAGEQYPDKVKNASQLLGKQSNYPQVKCFTGVSKC